MEKHVYVSEVGAMKMFQEAYQQPQWPRHATDTAAKVVFFNVTRCTEGQGADVSFPVKGKMHSWTWSLDCVTEQ